MAAMKEEVVPGELPAVPWTTASRGGVVGIVAKAVIRTAAVLCPKLWRARLFPLDEEAEEEPEVRRVLQAWLDLHLVQSAVQPGAQPLDTDLDARALACLRVSHPAQAAVPAAGSGAGRAAQPQRPAFQQRAADQPRRQG